MFEQKRPVTQLWAFSPTVAGGPLQDSSVTTLPETKALKNVPVREDSVKPAETVASKRSTPVDQSRLPLSAPRFYENEISIPKFKSKDVDQPVEDTQRGPYDEFMALDLAGTAMIGSENNEDPDLVAIKRVKKTTENRINRIAPFASDHLVQIKNVYEDINDIVIISETMDVTLRQLTGILQGPLKAFQIAAICKELLDGLSYLHKELALYHGELSCGTILLDLDGRVKIANVVESFIENRRLDPNSEKNDIRRVGSVMMELMEPETFILEPHSLVLRNADVWKDGHGIKDFLVATQQSTLETLKNHDFFQKSQFGGALNLWSSVLLGQLILAVIKSRSHRSFRVSRYVLNE